MVMNSNQQKCNNFFDKKQSQQRMFDISQKQWFIPRNQFVTKNGGMKGLFYHPDSFTELREYIIRIQCYYYESYLEVYCWRFNSDLPIYKPFHGSLMRAKRQSITCSVLIEAPDYFLYEVKQLKLSDTLSILKTCLVGLERMADKFGYFYLNDKMIGVTSEKVCKIWMNEDFSINTPQFTAQSQTDSIVHLIKLLSKYTEPTSKANLFFTKIQNTLLNLVSVQKYITTFANQNLLIIPPFIMHSTSRKMAQSIHCMSANSISYFISNQQSEKSLRNQKHKKNNNIMFESAFDDRDLSREGVIDEEEVGRYQSYQMMKKSQQTIHSTQVSHQMRSSLVVLPQFSCRMNKNNKCTMTKAFEVQVGQFKGQMIKKKSYHIPNRSTRCEISNCWSDNDLKSKQLVEECLSRNKWKTTINNLLDTKKVQLKDSIHIIEKHKPDPTKLEELKKLKLDKMSKTQNIFESIVEPNALQQINFNSLQNQQRNYYPQYSASYLQQSGCYNQQLHNLLQKDELQSQNQNSFEKNQE